MKFPRKLRARQGAVSRAPGVATRLAQANPAAWVALLLVAAVHLQAGASVSQEQQALESIAKATPLLDKIKAGGSVSDQEVKDARIGLMEPFMRMKAAYRRETDASEVTYAQDVAALQPQLMLAPASLVSAASRSQTRARLKTWQQAIGAYQRQMDSANARGLQGMKAIQPKLAASVYGPLADGFERAVTLVGDFVVSAVAGETAAVSGVAAMLDYMDSIPGGYALDQGAPPKLLFRDQATLDRYLQLLNEVQMAGQEVPKARARLTQALAEPSGQRTAPASR